MRMLSGGQRQGVAIARAAIWAQTVVLLDEPTAALGVRQRDAVNALIENLRSRDFGVLLISHDVPQVLSIADRVTVLRLGENAGTRAPRRRGRHLDRERDGGHRPVTAALRLARTLPGSGVFWIFVVLVALVAAFTAILPADTFATHLQRPDGRRGRVGDPDPRGRSHARDHQRRARPVDRLGDDLRRRRVRARDEGGGGRLVRSRARRGARGRGRRACSPGVAWGAINGAADRVRAASRRSWSRSGPWAPRSAPRGC